MRAIHGYKGQPVTWTTNNGQGAVNFVGSGRFGGINHFPENLDNGPANAYAAGSFIYNPVWIATSPPSGTYSVTFRSFVAGFGALTTDSSSIQTGA